MEHWWGEAPERTNDFLGAGDTRSEGHCVYTKTPAEPFPGCATHQKPSSHRHHGSARVNGVGALNRTVESEQFQPSN
jgi:hypothetical protein